MSLYEEIKEFVSQDETFLKAVLIQDESSLAKLSVLLERFDIFSYLSINDLSELPNLSILALDLKILIWQMLILDISKKERYHKRRLHFLKVKYFRLLRKVVERMKDLMLEKQAVEEVTFIKKWLKRDYLILKRLVRMGIMVSILNEDIEKIPEEEEVWYYGGASMPESIRTHFKKNPIFLLRKFRNFISAWVLEKDQKDWFEALEKFEEAYKKFDYLAHRIAAEELGSSIEKHLSVFSDIVTADYFQAQRDFWDFVYGNKEKEIPAQSVKKGGSIKLESLFEVLQNAFNNLQELMASL